MDRSINTDITFVVKVLRRRHEFFSFEVRLTSKFLLVHYVVTVTTNIRYVLLLPFKQELKLEHVQVPLEPLVVAPPTPLSVSSVV